MTYSDRLGSDASGINDATDPERISIPIRSVQFLVVDDRAFMRRAVCRHLESCGLDRPHVAEDGQEAVLLLRNLSSRPHGSSVVRRPTSWPPTADTLTSDKTDFKAAHAYCVIADFGMPKVNGLQLMQAIRCGEAGIPRDTPIILLTGYSDDYVVSTALLLDVNAFILKPVSRDTLWERVERALRSEVPVKSIAAYAGVAIPDELGAPVGAALGGPATQLDEAVSGIDWLSLAAVQPGAVLGGDLHSERGTLLLCAGTVFSEGTLHRLLDVQHMKAFSGSIPIRKSPEQAAAG